MIRGLMRIFRFVAGGLLGAVLVIGALGAVPAAASTQTVVPSGVSFSGAPSPRAPDASYADRRGRKRLRLHRHGHRRQVRGLARRGHRRTDSTGGRGYVSSRSTTRGTHSMPITDTGETVAPPYASIRVGPRSFPLTWHESKPAVPSTTPSPCPKDKTPPSASQRQVSPSPSRSPRPDPSACGR